MHRTTQTQNLKLEHFFEILTFDNLHLVKAHKRLSGVPRDIPDTIHVVPRLYFNLIPLLCTANPARTENKEFYL